MSLFGDLFTSQEAKEKERKARQRKALRMARNSIANVDNYIKTHKRMIEKAKKEAVEFKLKGLKKPYLLTLRSIRDKEIIYNRLEKKRWVQEQLLMQMELSGDDQNFINAAKAFQATFEFDVYDAENVLDDLMDVIKESSSDDLWTQISKNIEDEFEREEDEELDSIDGLEELDEEITKMALNMEASQRVGNSKVTGGDIEKKIKSEEDRISQLMESRRKNK